MFFMVSKIVWWLMTPSNLLILFTFFALLLSVMRHSDGWRMAALASAALLVVASVLPLGMWLRAPLENRFPVQSVEGLNPTGIIVLGGSVDENMSAARGGQVVVRHAGSRITEAVVLAKAYPQARLVLSGGSSALFLRDPAATEAGVGARLLEAMGVPRGQMVIEDQSRNTVENAAFTLALIKPQPGERWVLVTSAYHMPRAVGLFRRRGLEVIPYPVDFHTRNTWGERLRPVQPASEGLRLVDQSVREYIGLVTYYLTGKTSDLFPGPL